MSSPLSLEKPNISDHLGLNDQNDNDDGSLKHGGDISACQQYRDLANSSKDSQGSIKNQNAHLSMLNSFTVSTNGSSAPTSQGKMEIIMDSKDSLNEKKDESDFGSEKRMSEEKCDSEVKLSKITIFNSISQSTSGEDEKQDVIGQSDDETDTVMQEPDKRLISQENSKINNAETPQLQEAPAKRPQTIDRNLYKSILLEILKIFICIYKLNELQSQEISGKIQNEWDENTLKSNVLLVTALEKEESSEQDFEEWIMASKNKVALKDMLEDKRLGLFIPFEEEIKETKRYIKEKELMSYPQTYRSHGSLAYLKNLKEKGALICWILVVKFCLIWLPKGSPSEIMKLFPVKKDTIGLVYWMITTRTELQIKNLLKDFEEREKLRKNLQETFDTMEKSARKRYPEMGNLLDRIKVIGCPVPEPTSIIDMQTYLAFEAFEDSYYKGLKEAKSYSWFNLLEFNRKHLDTLPRYIAATKIQTEYIKKSCESQNGLMEVEEKVTPKKKKCNRGDGKRSQSSFKGESEEKGNKKFKKR